MCSYPLALVRILYTTLVPVLVAACGSSHFDRSLADLQAPVVATCAADNPHAQRHFRLLGEIRWDHDYQYGGIPVGGLSSIDYDPHSEQYYMVSDDRSVHGPARFYTARIQYDAQGLHAVLLTGMQALYSPKRQPYAGPQVPDAGIAVPDPEALRLIPDSGRMLWTSEGNFARGFGPELNEAQRDGQWLQHWPLPTLLQRPQGNWASEGPRNNMTLEGMSFSEDGRTIWLSMEGALRQDGPPPGPGQAGAPVRITALDAQTQQPIRQLAYQPDALPDTLWLMPRHAINGISDILADGPDHLLVLERAYSVGAGFSVRLYRINTQTIGPQAFIDTLPMWQLIPGGYQVADKQLVVDFSRLGLRTVDNIEGLTWGPPLPTGERVLVLVSDNNFNPAEVTQFIVLAEKMDCPAH